MLYLAVKGIGQVGRRRIRSQGVTCADRDFNEIDTALFLKHPSELIDGQGQQEDQGVQDVPLGFLETRRRQHS